MPRLSSASCAPLLLMLAKTKKLSSFLLNDCLVTMNQGGIYIANVSNIGSMNADGGGGRGGGRGGHGGPMSNRKRVRLRGRAAHLLRQNPVSPVGIKYAEPRSSR
ncbi:hypothetical protein CEP52_002746 [Fusarium oligoseptatum]|uniref:Uncharacterized protein n=1 Tax=Fusarium oligoseptatum TaxID=2604345 RepID=A0A428UC39_9HYPO|nr:hypothetical protein CEP52_002746 [Fusarium oligoseptatum]